MDIRMKWFYRIGFVLLLLVTMYVFFKMRFIWLPIIQIVFTILLPFIISAFITYLLHPVIERMHARGLHRGLAIFMIYVVFFGGLGYGFYKGIPALLEQVRELSRNAPFLAEQYRGWIEKIQSHTAAWPDGLQGKMNNGIATFERKLDNLLSIAIGLLMRFFNSVLIIAIIPFLSFYMLKDYPLIKKAAWYLTPRKWRPNAIHFLKDVDDSLGRYIRGQLLVCAVLGGISALLLKIFNLKYPLLLGAIIGITDVIPYFGPIIGAVPALIIAATMSPKMVITTLVIIVVLQFLEGNILSPYIVGKSLHMHPLVIMLAITAGGEIAGLAGLILAVPVLVVLKVGILHASEHFIRTREETQAENDGVK